MKRVHLEDWRREGETLVITGRTFHRARHVLRLRKGETLVGTDGQGNEYALEITGIGRNEISARILAAAGEVGEPALRVTLAQALPRGPRMDLVVQKATELGVERIVPLVAEHSVARPAAGAEVPRLERWRKIAAEAVAQSRRSRAPEITAPLPLGEFLRRARAPLRLVLQPGPGSVAFSALPPQRPEWVEVIVGPEGGWSASEMGLCLRAGFHPVSLGKRVLRAETAGMVIVSLLQYRWGDLG